MDHQTLLLIRANWGSLVMKRVLYDRQLAPVLNSPPLTHDLWRPCVCARVKTHPSQYLTSLQSVGPPLQKLQRNRDWMSVNSFFSQLEWKRILAREYVTLFASERSLKPIAVMVASSQYVDPMKSIACNNSGEISIVASLRATSARSSIGKHG